MSTENLPTQLLDNREAMLETLHMAYLNALDQCAVGFELQPSRLSEEDQKVLGRRLSVYWGMKPQSDAVATALSMAAESDARINACTPAQRAALEAEGRAMEERGKAEVKLKNLSRARKAFADAQAALMKAEEGIVSRTGVPVKPVPYVSALKSP